MFGMYGEDARFRALEQFPHVRDIGVPLRCPDAERASRVSSVIQNEIPTCSAEDTSNKLPDLMFVFAGVDRVPDGCRPDYTSLGDMNAAGNPFGIRYPYLVSEFSSLPVTVVDDRYTGWVGTVLLDDLDGLIGELSLDGEQIWRTRFFSDEQIEWAGRFVASALREQARRENRRLSSIETLPVPCEYCRAKAGEQCRTRSGRSLTYQHHERRRIIGEIRAGNPIEF